MDDPLVPESASPMKKNITYFFILGTAALALITLVLSLIYGTKPYHGGFIVIALALAGIIISTFIMLRWVRAGDMEDKVKYLTVFQNIVIILLCVGLLIAINTEVPQNCPPPPTCPSLDPNALSCYNRVSGVTPVVGNGLSLCSTNPGFVVNVDPCFVGTNVSISACIYTPGSF